MSTKLSLIQLPRAGAARWGCPKGARSSDGGRIWQCEGRGVGGRDSLLTTNVQRLQLVRTYMLGIRNTDVIAASSKLAKLHIWRSKGARSMSTDGYHSVISVTLKPLKKVV